MFLLFNEVFLNFETSSETFLLKDTLTKRERQTNEAFYQCKLKFNKTPPVASTIGMKSSTDWSNTTISLKHGQWTEALMF